MCSKIFSKGKTKMKKITAILLAMIVAVMCAVTTFAAPATATGTVYDFVANFETATSNGFGFAVKHHTHGAMGTTAEWFDGTQSMGPNLKGKHLATNQPLTGWGYYNSDGWGCAVGYVNNSITWSTADQMDNIIVFSAPVDGLYSYDMEGSQLWDSNASSVKYYVLVDGEVHNNNVASFAQGKTKAETAYNFEGSVELSMGQTIQFVYDCEDNAAGDNGEITKLQVKLDRAGKPPIEDKVGAVYDFMDSLGSPSRAHYTLGLADALTGEVLESTAKWYFGDDETVKHAGSGQPLNGWQAKDAAGHSVEMGYIGSAFVWYPHANYSNLIIFTAPLAGTYSYEFSSNSLWDVAHSTADYYVEIKGEKVATKSIAVGTAKGDPSVATFTGTVELNAGDTIIYACDPAGDMSGDNNTLLKVQVTLDAINANPTPTPNPGTSDVAVSIATAIAAAAVIGLAVAFKKH